jgi:hypothetical protein
LPVVVAEVSSVADICNLNEINEVENKVLVQLSCSHCPLSSALSELLTLYTSFFVTLTGYVAAAHVGI